jgi:hypothetical protein
MAVKPASNDEGRCVLRAWRAAALPACVLFMSSYAAWMPGALGPRWLEEVPAAFFAG